MPPPPLPDFDISNFWAWHKPSQPVKPLGSTQTVFRPAPAPAAIRVSSSRARPSIWKNFRLSRRTKNNKQPTQQPSAAR